MKIQKRTGVLSRTQNSWSSIYEDCSSLVEELEAKEIIAYDDDNFYEAFVIQFSYLEWHMQTAMLYYAKKLRVHPTTLKNLRVENSVSKKITGFDLIVSQFVSQKSKRDFKNLIEKLRDYNAFRNDFLHDSMNKKKFENAIHIEQSLYEAYSEGQDIIKLLLKIELIKGKI